MSRRLRLSAVFVLLALHMGSPTLSAQTLDGETADARSAFGAAAGGLLIRGDPEGAYQHFASSARADSNFAPAHYNAAYLAYMLGDADAAERWWISFLRADSTSRYAERARLYLGTEAKTESDESYSGLLRKAQKTLHVGELERAAAFLEEAHARRPGGWEAPALLGRVFVLSGQLDLASVALTIAWNLAPSEHRPRLRRILHQLQSADLSILSQSANTNQR